jgi:hypothetical protein
MQSRRAFALLAAACAGGALWFSLGAVAVIANGSGFTRIGSLPPLWLLPVLIVSLAGVSWLTSLSSRASIPLFLSLLLVLPWLPFRCRLAHQFLFFCHSFSCCRGCRSTCLPHFFSGPRA